jgi:hypothetical protein
MLKFKQDVAFGYGCVKCRMNVYGKIAEKEKAMKVRLKLSCLMI